MELQNFIGGEFVSAESKKTFPKYSPFDGSSLAEVSSSDAMDVIKALQQAKKAAVSFKDSTLESRAQLLLKMADILAARSEEVAYEEALYQGLSQSFVLENSVKVAEKVLRDTVASLLQPLPQQTLVQPTGIVGIITPWSLSLRLVIERLAPTLAAGNVALVKVSEQSPITVKILGEIFQEAALPAGVVNVLQGAAEVGATIAGHPSIRAVSAAGKSATLESIAKAGLTQFKKLQLSGGAKNPAMVLADFDFRNRMPEILFSFLMGQGQMCWNTSRIFVLESFAKEFFEVLIDYLSTLQPLQNPRESSPWTPLISEAQSAHIHVKIQEGISEHGKVFFGGEKTSGPGYFYKPTVMLDLPNCSVLQQDELQGPLLLITPVKYQHEILKWANTSYLAHSGVIWGPAEKVPKIAHQLECAHIWVNRWMKGESETIFGLKQSSFGNLDMKWFGSFYSDAKKLTEA
ncbi:aldehyde dehydrogenase family protein [Bdellovibrio bacteriovorus]|uniref:aldehyde dehydrogenase family protein n=1 Tax=Bdellovibrio bacteriovorus TaxID=959 RepID=UPI0035A6F4EB